MKMLAASLLETTNLLAIYETISKSQIEEE